MIIDQYDSDGTVFRELDLLDDLVCQLRIEGFQTFGLFNNASKLIFNVCLIADLTVAQGGSPEQLFPKGILVEVISLKGPCDLVVKAPLLDGQLLLAVSMGMDHIGIANQSIQKLRDFFHQRGICLFDLGSALAAAPLLNTFTPCILPTMHRLTAGWADNRDFQPVDSGLPIRA